VGYDYSVSRGSEIRSGVGYAGEHMSRRGVAAGSLAAMLLFAGAARADDKEPTAIVAIGGMTEWSLTEGGTKFGPTVSVEFTPISNWLEIEVGVSSLFGRGQTEWSADLIFKKPFTLSDKVEFMIGVGPEWKISSKSVAAEAVLDFMFWPGPERKIGWFLEPTYSCDFGSGHEKSLGVSVGLLIAIP
jgi:hypothetical protein